MIQFPGPSKTRSVKLHCMEKFACKICFSLKTSGASFLEQLVNYIDGNHDTYSRDEESKALSQIKKYINHDFDILKFSFQHHSK